VKTQLNKNTNHAPPKALKNSAKLQRGFSLIEVMVAAIILSIGILGVVSLQILGMKGTQQSFMKQQAMSVVQNLTERMHSNKQGVAAGNYIIADSSTFDCSVLPSCSGSSSTCSVAEIATVDLHNLICGYKAGSFPSTGGVKAPAPGDLQGLVNGELNVTCPNAGGCVTGDVQISVLWDERELGSEDNGVPAGTPSDSLVVNTRIIR
jgi:type IV pilus assembly protein PilV